MSEPAVTTPGPAPAVVELTTPHGPARAHMHAVEGARAALLLGHGANGSVTAPDLRIATEVAIGAGVTVALFEQPYRVAGRRAPVTVAARLDEAFRAAVAAARAETGEVPLVVGGRSAGARVACRTALSLGAAGVVALAFPLHPPGRPERSRAAELPAGIPTLVVNGDRDPFGAPEPGGSVEVALRPGAVHDLRRDLPGTAEIVVAWLRGHGWAR